MTSEISKEKVVNYYNEHTRFKINDFASVSPRIEAAWGSLIKYAPQSPKRILEVGCGVGSISHRMKKHWPDSQVYGLDISTESIEMAKKLFSREGLFYLCGTLTKDRFDDGFDFIVFMDVYEHISIYDRDEVHSSLSTLLNNKGRIFLSVPTPHNLKWSDKYKPHTMQPVDEHISFEVIGKLASETGTEVLLYQIKDVWNIGDYAHIVLEKNNDFEAAFFHPKPLGLYPRLLRLIGKIKNRIIKPFRVLWIKSKLL